MDNMTPEKFIKLFSSNLDINDLVVLCHIPYPNRPLYQMYEIKDCINVQGGRPFRFLNVPIQELKKYAKKSIVSGLPVWFVGDVRRGYHPYKSALNDQLFEMDHLFGPAHPMDKSQRLQYRLAEGNHAMTLVGVNTGANDQPNLWQVENSWGYWDYETPGLDGFVSMSDQWFTDNLFQIAVHQLFLSRSLRDKLAQEPIQLEMWDSMAPALQVKSMEPPKKFQLPRGPRASRMHDPSVRYSL